MGKRKHKDSDEYLKKKIRKLEKRLRRRRRHCSDSEGSSNSHTNNNWSRAYSRRESISAATELTDSDDSNHNYTRSEVHVVNVHNEDPRSAVSDAYEPMPSTSQQNLSVTASNFTDPPPSSLPADILELLGEAKGKQEVFGPKIQEDISKRWGRILCEGLNKELKKTLSEKFLVPENFQLVKAPKLNPEIGAVLNESVRNRDKRLENNQNYLGVGISALTQLISSLIDKEVEKNDIIKQLSETNQILLDLHSENTLSRRKLITYALDKKFLGIIQDVKRDSFLFGENLTEKIKASKSAERSGLQIKKSILTDVLLSKKPSIQQGNWRGPPRQAQRGNRQGGTKTRPTYRPTRRPDRFQEPSKVYPQKRQSKPQ